MPRPNQSGRPPTPNRSGTDSTPLPGFGLSARHLWRLASDIAFLNHGSFGATPVAVLDAQARWRDQMEDQPVAFMRDRMPPALEAARQALATFLGSDSAGIALVENASAATTVVLRSLSLRTGDEVLLTSWAYPAVRAAAEQVCAPVSARVVEAPLSLADRSSGALVHKVAATMTTRTRLVILDHVASAPPVALPVMAIAEHCRSRGIPILVDGAHAPGMLPLNLPHLGVDWYAGNCHKWLCAPKGTGFLWAAPDRRHALNPPVLSHHAGNGLPDSFAWQGTRDMTAWLSLPEVLRFRSQLDRSGDVSAYCSGLAQAGAAHLSNRWGTASITGDTDAGPSGTRLFMTAVRLPDTWQPRNARADHAAATKVRNALWHRNRIEALALPVEDALWIRLSTFVYNDIGEVATLADAVAAGPPEL